MLWDRATIRFSELPSLQEVLQTCDRSKLEKVILADHALNGRKCESYGKKRVKSMRKRLGKTLDALCALDTPEQEGHHRVLVPQETFVLHAKTNLIERRIHAALVSLDEIGVVECAREALGQRVGTYRDMRTAQRRARKQVQAVWGGDLPHPLDFTGAPWSETLASKVWLGSGLCRRERYMVVASAVWEMTYFGFSQAEVETRIAETDAGSRAGESAAEPFPPMVPSASELDFGLKEPDRFSQRYVQQLARRVGVLNHNAAIDFYERQLDLAKRLELTSDAALGGAQQGDRPQS